jgi:hypothetical protein
MKEGEREREKNGRFRADQKEDRFESDFMIGA